MRVGDREDNKETLGDSRKRDREKGLEKQGRQRQTFFTGMGRG